ncbi:hypothetical protein PIB30_087608, partial [Stylosanthes scabra]|nr:hypothetical protein [Stylosanthes scabra]
AKESIGSKGFMKRSQERRNVASRVASKVASRLHKQLEKLPTNSACCTSNSVGKQKLPTQPASASSVACATIDDAQASCSTNSPKLKARSEISSLGA